MENNNSLDSLNLDNSGNDTTPNSDALIFYEKLKENISEIYLSLNVPLNEYQPEHTVEIINNFIAPSNKISRILYSEINIWIMGLNDEEKGIINSNLDKLLLHVINLRTFDDMVKIVVKIYDHMQLINSQNTNIEKIFANRIEKAKEQAQLDIQSDVKIIEREYITILGIFAAIILAFVGTFTFSTSVLNNVGNAPLFSLLIISSIIGCVFYKIIFYSETLFVN